MPDARPTTVRYRVLAALCAAAAIAYIQRNLITNATTTLPIRAERGLSREQMGALMGSWLWTYAIFQIPAGRLADAWGARRALSLYCALWSLFTVLFAFAPWYWLLYLIGILFGAAQAGIFPCAAIIVRQWFPAEKRGLSTAFIAAFQQVGGALGALLGGFWIGAYLRLWKPEWTAAQGVTVSELPRWLAALSESAGGAAHRFFHWSGIFVWLSIPGLIWAAWFCRWYRDVPLDDPRLNDAERALLPAAQNSAAAPHAAPRAETNDAAPLRAPGSERSLWGAMLTSPTMWLICAQQFCRALSYIFYGTWFPEYLKDARGLTVAKSGAITSLMFVAALFGALLGGAISDAILARTGSRRIAKQGMAFVSLLGAGAFLASAFFVPSVPAAVAVLFAGSFMASLAGPISYSVTIDVSGRETATVFGAMNMSGNIGALLLPIAVPYILKLPAWEPLRSWFQSLQIGGWDLVLFTCAGSYVVAAACWLLLNPSGTIFDRKETRAEAARTIG